MIAQVLHLSGAVKNMRILNINTFHKLFLKCSRQPYSFTHPEPLRFGISSQLAMAELIGLTFDVFVGTPPTQGWYTILPFVYYAAYNIYIFPP